MNHLRIQPYGYALLALAAIAFVATTTSCGRMGYYPYDQISTNSGSRISAPPVIGKLTVIDLSGQPISGARLLIGPRENVPFAGNFLTTDSHGQIEIPAQWTNPQPVTIEAKGFVRTTYFGRMPQAANLSLKRMLTPQRIELKGETKGFGTLTRDGFVDFGFVAPAVTRSQASTIQLVDIISPEVDTISIFGRSVDVPSNITLPNQTENYIFPITLDKPAYRMYVGQPGLYTVIASHARFPMKKVIDEVRGGKKIYDVINHFEFKNFAVHQVSLTAPSLTKDLSVSGTPVVPAKSVTAPNFDSKFTLLAAHLAEQNGLYIITDVKNFEPKEKRTLAAPKQGAPNGLVVAALKRDGSGSIGAQADEITTVTMPANQSQTFEFLESVSAPELRSKTLVLDPPKELTGVYPSITYAVLSKVELIEKSQMKLERKTPQWELYSHEWATSLELPDFPVSAGAPVKEKLRWEALFGGEVGGAASEVSGPETLEKVTHVTRSAVDLP